MWGCRRGAPPSGLELNAPFWYADGYAQALVDEGARADRRREAHVWSCVRALATPRAAAERAARPEARREPGDVLERPLPGPRPEPAKGGEEGVLHPWAWAAAASSRSVGSAVPTAGRGVRGMRKDMAAAATHSAPARNQARS